MAKQTTETKLTERCPWVADTGKNTTDGHPLYTDRHGWAFVANGKLPRLARIGGAPCSLEYATRFTAAELKR